MIRRTLFLLLLLVLCLACTSGDKQKYTMSDAQLGLTPPQAEGRHIYDRECLQCHASYTSEGRKAMSLMGLYKRQYLPSGLPASDEHVAEVVTHGKRMMPAIPLTQEQLNALIAYLHTL